MIHILIRPKEPETCAKEIRNTPFFVSDIPGYTKIQFRKFLDAPHGKAVRTVVLVRHIQATRIEIQVAPVHTTLPTGRGQPAVTVGTDVVERPLPVVPIA